MSNARLAGWVNPEAAADLSDSLRIEVTVHPHHHRLTLVHTEDVNTIMKSHACMNSNTITPFLLFPLTVTLVDDIKSPKLSNPEPLETQAAISKNRDLESSLPQDPETPRPQTPKTGRRSRESS